MTRILFVCTGNTCRSALAEGLARARLGSEAGVTFESAGLHALGGAPATPHALVVAAEEGVDLGAHRARPTTEQMIERADRVYVMTRAQLDGLACLGTGVGERAALLDPSGEDIPDPYGGDLDAYRRVRDRVVAAIEERREDWRAGR